MAVRTAPPANIIRVQTAETKLRASCAFPGIVYLSFPVQ
nr:MAG TPA: hypothetical protein [Caudoviricetes sp.]